MLAELKDKFSKLENVNQAIDDFKAIKSGQVKLESLEGRRAEDVKALMDIDQRSGGLNKLVSAQIAKQEQLKADSAKFAAEIKKQMDEDFGGTRLWGTLSLVGLTAKTAVHGVAAAVPGSGAFGERLMSMGESVVETGTGLAKGFGLDEQSAPGDALRSAPAGGSGSGQPGQSSAPGSGGGATTGQGQSGSQAAGKGPVATAAEAVAGDKGEAFAGVPKSAASAAGDFQQARAYERSGNLNDLIPPEDAPKRYGQEALTSGAGVVVDLQKGASSYQKMVEANAKGDTDAAATEGFKSLNHVAKVGTGTVETIDNIRNYRTDGKAGKSERSLKFFESADRITSVGVAGGGFSQMTDPNATQAQRDAAYITTSEHVGNMIAGKDGAKLGKGNAEGVVSLRTGRDAFREERYLEGTGHAVVGVGQMLEANSVLVSNPITKYSVENWGKAAKSAGQGVIIFHEMRETSNLETRLTSQLQTMATNERAEENLRILRMLEERLNSEPGINRLR